jgi:VanZ family protein
VRSGNSGGFPSAVLPAIVYAVLLYWISSLPNPNAPDFGLEWGDKINHAGAFGLMALLWFRALGWITPRRSRRSRLFLTLLLVAAYGATDEIHQSFVPGRFADITDWIADVVGAIIAIGVVGSLRDSSSFYRRLFPAYRSEEIK